ncbi:helix-turn-helix transcriptional regulator [Lacticaseibacillus sp. GG6-2]
MIIGEQLKSARIKSGRSQESLAEFLGVSRQTISNWETSRSYPDIERVMRLADLYHLSLDEMLRGDQQMVKSWADATNVVKIGRWLATLLLVNIVLTVGMLIFSQVVWLTAIFLLLIVGSIATAFFLMIKLI